MWVFYLISLPLTLGLVVFTLRYFAGPEIPRYVLVTVGYTWFCSVSVIILAPADIWTCDYDRTIRLRAESFASGLLYNVKSPKGSLRHCLCHLIILRMVPFHSCGVGHTGVRFCSPGMNSSISFPAFALALCYPPILADVDLSWAVVPLIQGFEDAGDFTVSERLKTSVHVNLVFYLVLGFIGLLGLILLIMMHGNCVIMAVAFVPGVAQATSTQMSKRDPMRPYMNVIDAMLDKMFREDPSFKPQGGQLGENDMDYDTDEKSMATLRRHLRNAKEEYYRYKSEYLTYVTEALVLEDTVKNYERRDSTGWKYISSFRTSRSGKWGNLLDTLEFIWRCVLKKQIQMVLAIVTGIMSAAILLAEATLLLSKLDLSLFSILIRMIARYAPPISYNFINLIQLRSETIFEKKMGRIDDAVPVFGQRFNEIYPLIMVIYTLLVASNFFDRVFNYFGSWKRFKFQTETDDMDGFDPSGLMILRKERTWLEEGQKVGELVLPLARNFNDVDDIEQGSNFSERSSVEMKMSSNYDTIKGSSSNDAISRKYGSAREAITNKYAAIREQQNRYSPSPVTKSENMASARVSLLERDSLGPSNGEGGGSGESSSRLASTWRNMQLRIQSFKENVATKKFLPLRQGPETATVSGRVMTSAMPQSLDDIFQRLKNRSVEHGHYLDDDDE
ncbi:hypothetical protein Bca101_042264 [Brassica carinata]